MIIPLSPQPQRWFCGHWWHLNYLYSEAELPQRFTLIDGVWYA